MEYDIVYCMEVAYGRIQRLNCTTIVTNIPVSQKRQIPWILDSSDDGV
jgi:hypothetical protein